MDNFTADGIYIDAPPARVYAALIDPREVRVWFEAEGVELEPVPGGKFFARRLDGSTASGTLAFLEPGRCLEITGFYRERPGDRRGPMKLCFLLERQEPGTWLIVRQEGLDTGPDWKAFAWGVHQELVRLTVSLKRHIEEI